jgi:hypothetical protein
MNETSSKPHCILHLIIEGFSAENLAEFSVSPTTDGTEIFPLTEASAGEALGKIFAADTVAVWSKL